MTEATPWTVIYHRDLEKEIRLLPKPYIRRILEMIEGLAQDPRRHGSEKLDGHDLWKVRVGLYRIIYHIDDHQHIVSTYRIGHRKDVYRNL
ncbi:MAG: type II toxin-antitoxin system RelE/ParE family toxin [Chloroflexi bacterium]|nr:type II toxin-antitoxin system RelE/ParE family toxin [Chloroflexota bacterium]